MLDRLPFELLQHILRLAAPVEYSPDKYKERRELLLNCCLVDKRTKEVAQQMLPEVFVARSEKQEKVLDFELEDGKTRGELVKLLVVGSSGEVAKVGAAEILESCPGLVSLIAQQCRLDLGWLSGISTLRCLYLHHTALTCPSNLILPSLIELSCVGHFPPLLCDVLFTSTCLPSLRALAFANDGPILRGEPNFPRLPPSFLHQLDILDAIDMYNLAQDEIFKLDTDRILLHRQYEEILSFFGPTSTTLPSALRIHSLDDLAGSRSPAPSIQSQLDALQNLVDFTENLSVLGPHECALHSLVLPEVIHPARLTPGKLVDQVVRALLDFCNELDVDVLWEDEQKWGVESLVSPVFWEWARRKKREEEGGVQAKVGDKVEQEQE